MKNREKFKDEIIDFALNEDSIAVDSQGEIVGCRSIQCKDCKFHEKGADCETVIRRWLEEEYVEPPTIRISKKDRAFLEYIKDGYEYIARDLNGSLCLYTTKPERNREVWFSNPGFVNLKRISVDFPMVKWDDKEPWKIDDLEKLEVVDSYI